MSTHDTPDDVTKVRKFEHPGKGRVRARPVPKGRQIDPHATATISALLGDGSRERHMLIEYLHLIQDEFGQISAPNLAALADEMRLSFAEVFETATFYAHFDVIKEGEKDIPALTVRVCDSLTCAMLGGEQLLAALKQELEPGVRVVRAPCVGLSKPQSLMATRIPTFRTTSTMRLIARPVATTHSSASALVS
jgi:formate dehydrogenase beta subunit